MFVHVLVRFDVIQMLCHRRQGGYGRGQRSEITVRLLHDVLQVLCHRRQDGYGGGKTTEMTVRMYASRWRSDMCLCMCLYFFDVTQMWCHRRQDGYGGGQRTEVTVREYADWWRGDMCLCTICPTCKSNPVRVVMQYSPFVEGAWEPDLLHYRYNPIQKYVFCVYKRDKYNVTWATGGTMAMAGGRGQR